MRYMQYAICDTQTKPKKETKRTQHRTQKTSANKWACFLPPRIQRHRLLYCLIIPGVVVAAMYIRSLTVTAVSASTCARPFRWWLLLAALGCLPGGYIHFSINMALSRYLSTNGACQHVVTSLPTMRLYKHTVISLVPASPVFHRYNFNRLPPFVHF